MIRPPPSGSSPDDDRDLLCWAAIRGPLTELRNAAVTAGWADAEIVTAILSLVVAELREMAGVDAAAATLRAALTELTC
jgi:hypothetical protein